MKYNIKTAIRSLFANKNWFLDVLFISLVILVTFIIFAIRSYDGVEGGFITSACNLYIGTPFLIPYLNFFDIMQLAFAGVLKNWQKILYLSMNLCIITWLFGCYFSYANSRCSNKEFKVLCIDNIKKSFQKGYEYILGTFILILPVLIIVLCAIKGVYWYFSNLSKWYDDGLNFFYSIIRSQIVISTVLISLIPVVIIMIASAISYIKDLKFSSLFSIKNVIFGNFKIYIKCFMWLLFFNVLYFLLSAVVVYFSFIKTGVIANLLYSGQYSIIHYIGIVIGIVLQIMLLIYYSTLSADLLSQAALNINISVKENNLIKKIYNLRYFFVPLIIVLLVTNFYMGLYQKNYDEVIRLKKSYSLYNKAMEKATKKYGSYIDWNVQNAEDFYSFINEFLPIESELAFLDDFPAIYTSLNSKKEIKLGKKFYGFYLNDGSLGFIYLNFPKCGVNDSINGEGPLTSICGSIWVDVNGFGFPNVYGIDLFQFVITESGKLVPRGDKDDRVYPVSKYCSNISQKGDACAGQILSYKNTKYYREWIKRNYD